MYKNALPINAYFFSRNYQNMINIINKAMKCSISHRGEVQKGHGDREEWFYRVLGGEEQGRSLR